MYYYHPINGRKLAYLVAIRDCPERKIGLPDSVGFETDKLKNLE